MKKVTKGATERKNELPAFVVDSGTKPRGAVEVRFTLTEDQHKAVSALCDDYRLGIHEAAKYMLLSLLRNGDYEEWLPDIVRDANEDARTGKHPEFEQWKMNMAEQAKEAAAVA